VRHPEGWSVAGILTVRERSPPVELTLVGLSASTRAAVLPAAGTVDRCAHGITQMPGMAARRRLSVEITARGTRT
jgi:hypothetical protein